MNKLMTALTAIIFSLNVSAFTPSVIEQAAASFLNVESIEAYNITQVDHPLYDGAVVRFDYTVEVEEDFSYYELDYSCEGLLGVDGSGVSFWSLDCEMIEPILWDEL